ncbi:putative Rab GTPase-activating protein 1-like [Trypoxylus dichotomus]
MLNSFSDSEVRKLQEYISAQMDDTGNTAESSKKHLIEKQTVKFQRIDNSTKRYKLDPTRTIVNSTDKILLPDVIHIHKKGGNFAVTPKSIPKEEASRCGSRLRRMEMRLHTDAHILRTSKLPRSNIFPAEWKALQQLKQDESLTIIQADKGNATVRVYIEEYKQKIKMLLEPPTYVTRQQDPMSS